MSFTQRKLPFHEDIYNDIVTSTQWLFRSVVLRRLHDLWLTCEDLTLVQSESAQMVLADVLTWTKKDTCLCRTISTASFSPITCNTRMAASGYVSSLRVGTA